MSAFPLFEWNIILFYFVLIEFYLLVFVWFDDCVVWRVTRVTIILYPLFFADPFAAKTLFVFIRLAMPWHR